MKLRISLLLLFNCCLQLLGVGQSTEPLASKRTCGATSQIHETRIRNNPSYAKYVNKWKVALKNKTAQRSPNCSNGPIIIPIAIHFQAGVVPANSEACAIGLAVEQINILNQKINGIDPDNSAYSNFQDCLAPIGSACLSFCIASQNHPSGYGLNNGDLAITFGKVDFNNLNPGASVLPIDPNWAGYLNIFVGNLDGGLLGQSGIPGNINSGSGVVVTACTFGSGNFNCNGFNNTTTCGGIFNGGETLIHEIGHYLGLFHIWGDGGCNQDDNIRDTPNMDNTYDRFTDCGSHFSCNDLPSSCGSRDMYMNYMSYAADQCMYMFSSAQADKMYQTAEFFGFDTNVPSVCSGENTKICTGSDYTYRITNVNSGLVLEVNEASVNAGANVQQASNNNSTAQQWYFQDVGNAQFSITNVNSGLVLDIDNGSTAAGANLQQWIDNGSGAQLWSLQNLGKDEYFITNANSGIVLDVSGASTAVGANVQQWEINGTGAQLWLLNLVSGDCNSDNNCAGQGGDTDNDGICNNQDACPNLDDNFIGTFCNDNNPNTENDIWQSDCTCAGTLVSSKISAKVFLEGYYDGNNGLTRNNNYASLIPNNQPFNAAPWFYNGNETATNIPANAVDWILIATRTANGDILEQKAGFITTTGEVMDIDGTMGIPFNNAATHFSIHHKSHLAIMSASAYISGTYDFTTDATKAIGNGQQIQQGNSYMMYSGDYDCNGIINNLDYNLWQQQGATISQYLSVDGDGNGIINNLDYNLWTKNRSKIGHPPLRY